MQKREEDIKKAFKILQEHDAMLVRDGRGKVTILVPPWKFGDLETIRDTDRFNG